MADDVETRRIKVAEAGAKRDRERELSVRKVRGELAKTQVSVIVHSPAQK